MIAHNSILVTLVRLVDCLPSPPPPAKRGRGHPKVYSDQLFFKALVVMIVKQLHTVNELRAVLEQPTTEMQTLKAEFTTNGKYPTRRTWERRLKNLPDSLADQISLMGQYLLEVVQPWTEQGRAASIDSTVLKAKGGVWHKKDREAGEVPHSSIDTEAHWTKSGWHGWVYGWKLHLVTTIGKAWIPLKAEVTSANQADNVQALSLVAGLSRQVRYVLGDTHYNDPELRELCEKKGKFLIATQTDSSRKKQKENGGNEVRKIFHQLRSHSIENFNEHFKSIFNVHASVPTKGLAKTRLWILGCVYVYQLTLLCRHQNGQALRRGLKAFLKAA